MSELNKWKQFCLLFLIDNVSIFETSKTMEDAQKTFLFWMGNQYFHNKIVYIYLVTFLNSYAIWSL